MPGASFGADQYVMTLPGAVAGADLSAASAQYKWVKLGGSSSTLGGRPVILCNGTTDEPIGILWEGNQQGFPVKVVMCAEASPLQGGAAAALAVGDHVGTDASGQGVKVQASDTTVYAPARCIKANTAHGGLAVVTVNTLALRPLS